jgi:transcriptional regulator with XRE-family HTH domain
MGRPSKFDPVKCEQARKLSLLGATDKELADFFNVSESTLNKWKLDHPAFSESIKAGKEDADANVANRLYLRALGYEHPDVHISNYQGEVTLTPITKVYPPDPASAIFWLKNRQRAKWREKIDHEHAGPNGGPIPVVTAQMTPEEAARAYKEVMRGGS